MRGRTTPKNREGEFHMTTLRRLLIAAGFIGTIVGAGATGASAQGVYLEGPGFGIGIGKPSYQERRYRGYDDYAGPRFYSERRYHRGPRGYERDSYRLRDRDWD
jgi:hypothetical protein